MPLGYTQLNEDFEKEQEAKAAEEAAAAEAVKAEALEEPTEDVAA